MFEVNDDLIMSFFPYEKMRYQQYKAIRKILEAYARGKKVVILEAPTGVGKSGIAITVARYMNHVISTTETPHRTILTTIQKYLQDQYRKDFPFLKDIRNARDEKYTCSIGENKGTEGCIINRKKTDDKCWKVCPYKLAMLEFRRGPISITNSHFYALAPFRYGMAIMDECHDLSSVISSQAELKMQPMDITKLSLILRENTDSVMEAWSKVAKFVSGIEDKQVFDFMNTEFLLDIDLDKYQERVDNLAGEKEFRPVSREWNKLKNNITKAYLVSEAKMVKVIEQDKERNVENTVIRPIYAREFAPTMLFQKADRYLLMSATVCGFEGLTKELGIENMDWEGIEVDHAIDVERREVHFSPVSWMSAKTEEADIKRSVQFIDEAIDKFKANTIIHSASYKRANEFAKLSKHEIYVPKNASDAINHLQVEKDFGKVGIVASPSLVAGVDAKDDLCRLNIISKVMYPSFGDPRIRYLSKHDPDLLNQGIVRSIVQAAGRGTRHEEDHSWTYVIDGCFERLYSQYETMFPKWFRDSLKGI